MTKVSYPEIDKLFKKMSKGTAEKMTGTDPAMKKIVYSEPADYFPEEIRKKYKLGEYAEKKTVEKPNSTIILKDS